ncbi:hypothetical protein HMPREF9445_00458 [Bacteroides clarus YIT 12056]|uniref:Uncharacterized protein n=1 Tax=Bacteroides clarus YIT 12056 TaxID=762984 RepID=A0ABN0CSA7_9BACE|nr:hypothetical protein HMPREF9445_00458 [Bacteroides clarus YIT 12056]
MRLPQHSEIAIIKLFISFADSFWTRHGKRVLRQFFFYPMKKKEFPWHETESFI